MGYNSTVLILNDRVDEIRRDPERFVGEMLRSISSMAMRSEQVDFYPGQSTVMTCEHADTVSIIAIGGNCATVLGRIWNGGHHHTADDQESLLRQLADQHGFQLRRKPQKKTRA